MENTVEADKELEVVSVPFSSIIVLYTLIFAPCISQYIPDTSF